jgi:hypothetical protein
MLSLVTGIGSFVGVTVLSGRKMVLKPLPAKLPENAASGPRLGGGGGGGGAKGDGSTSPKMKSVGSPIFAATLIGAISVFSLS